MAFKHDPDGPYVDKGGLRASIFAYLGAIVVVVAILFFAYKLIYSDKDRFSKLQDEIRTLFMSSTFNYVLEPSDDSLIIRTFKSGTVDMVILAGNGNSKSLESWNTIKEWMESCSEAISSRQVYYDIEDYDIALMVVDENNHQKALLSYVNGKLDYDIVPLLSQGS